MYWIGEPIPHGKQHFWVGHMPANYNVGVTTAGDCAWPENAVNKWVCRREGWRDGDAAFCQITLHIRAG